MGIKRGGSGMAAGTLAPFAGGTIPAGWLSCAGQAVSRSTYAALFLAIGTAHGAGDGATTFNVPDLRGRAVFGKDDMNGIAANRLTIGGSGINGATLGGVGGGETVTLNTTQMPSHAHDKGNYGNGNIAAGAVIFVSNGSGQNTTSQGGGAAHANVPPALVAHYIIKT